MLLDDLYLPRRSGGNGNARAAVTVDADLRYIARRNGQLRAIEGVYHHKGMIVGRNREAGVMFGKYLRDGISAHMNTAVGLTQRHAALGISKIYAVVEGLKPVLRCWFVYSLL